ncbi:MAG: asparagine synthase (glutamine-hydrolyzing) [Gammaproteobacteria bacterium]
MCGIAGFFGRRTVSNQVVEQVLSVLRRRGPDAQHTVHWDAQWQRSDQPVTNALLHARLSIMDPRPEADQPMSNDGGDIWICYNGEVYDWQEDADALRRQGVTFRTRSDTEFILRAYEAWGMDFISRLRGMFAIVIMDLRQKKVMLIRDRMGLKPLVYYHQDGELAFGSTVRAVLPYVPTHLRQFSLESIDAYLAHRYIPAPHTIFKHISRLENGHYLNFDLDTRELTKHCYWQAAPEGRDHLKVLDDAIKIRTVADRPLGLFLSGGIDSSVLAARLSALGYRDIHSYTAAFPGSDMDESEQAKAVACMTGIPCHAINIPEKIAGDFEQIIADLDEPFADPSSFPMWYLARETAQHVKVVLSGDGGDELLAGYKRYGKHLRTAWRSGISLPFLPLRPMLDSKGMAKLATELRMSWLEAYSLRFSGFTPNQRQYLQPQYKLPRAVYWRMNGDPQPSPLHALIDIDLKNYLPEYILRKSDLCTMAHGLELRAPLLDHRWYQTLLTVSDGQRFTFPPKLLLKPACAPCDALGLFDQKKRGFNPPLGRWLKKDLAQRCSGLGERLSLLTEGQLAQGAINNAVDYYQQGANHMAEQVLQLLILDESLRQLDVLRKILI